MLATCRLSMSTLPNAAGFRGVHQQGLDTSTPAGKAMFQMLGVFAEFERAMIVERVQAGLRRARAQGKRLGRPRVARRWRRRSAAGWPGVEASMPRRGRSGSARGRYSSGHERNRRGRRNSGLRPLGLLPESDLLSWLRTHSEARWRRPDDHHDEHRVVSRNGNEAASFYRSPRKFSGPWTRVRIARLLSRGLILGPQCCRPGGEPLSRSVP